MVSSYRLGMVLFCYRKRTRPPRLWAEWNYKWKLANSNYRKTYINLKQIVHSLNLRSPLFRIDWCGNYCPSPRRTFHSSRRSGSVLVLFCYRKRTRPPRLWAEWNYTCLVTPSIRKFVFACGPKDSIGAKNIWYFFLDEKVSKTSRKNDASTAQGKTPGPPFFHPTARIFCFIEF